MSMTRCPECQWKVSDQADACPHCAYPLRRAGAPAGAAVVQTIEKTSKELKIQTLGGAVVIAVGIVVIMLGGAIGGDGVLLVVPGVFLAMAGVAWLVFVKIKIWWHHE